MLHQRCALTDSPPTSYCPGCSQACQGDARDITTLRAERCGNIVYRSDHRALFAVSAQWYMCFHHKSAIIFSCIRTMIAHRWKAPCQKCEPVLVTRLLLDRAESHANMRSPLQGVISVVLLKSLSEIKAGETAVHAEGALIMEQTTICPSFAILRIPSS